MTENTKEEQKKRVVKLIFAYVLVVIGVVLIYFLGKIGIGIPCVFNRITGLLCPGCGNTRAALAILRLDFASAISYNLLFPLEFVYLGWVVILSSISYVKGNGFSYKPPCRTIDIVLLISVIIWGVVRNIPAFM